MYIRRGPGGGVVILRLKYIRHRSVTDGRGVIKAKIFVTSFKNDVYNLETDLEIIVTNNRLT